MTGGLLGVILAGGKAERMGGGDKCLLPLGGRPILSHVIAGLRPQADAVILNANGDAARFAGFGLPVVADDIAGQAGPLAGILAAMEYAAAHGYDHVLSVAADTPFFPADLADRLTAAAEATGKQIAMVTTKEEDGRIWRQPVFGLWDVGLRGALRQALLDGTRKIVVWADQHGVAPVEFPDEMAFFNINAPEDLARGETLLGEVQQ